MRKFFTLLLILSFFKIYSQTTIDFDNVLNWTAGSGSITSYFSDHLYTANNWTFTGGDALRNTTSIQDGVAGANGTYSWRLRDAAGVIWSGTYNTSGTVSQFGFAARRWDNTPDPNYIVTYSINGGSSYSSTIFTINNSSLGNSSGWTTYSYVLPVAASVSSGQFIVRFERISGERIMVDDFTFTSTPLPIELISFKSLIEIKSTLLNWITASETNNSHFNIERSADARNFESIGEIKGAGNSSKEISYAFTDERPLPGINYYRIKQTDFDGQYSYSEIRSVRHKGISNVSITPRTTDGRVDIITELENYSIAIYNASGQEVKKMTGMSLDQSISLETLHAGVYFVKINSRSESETVRIVKI